MSMSWYESAYEHMARIYSEHIGESPESIAKAIDDGYPFGMRKYSPYKSWLKARREFFAKYQLPGLKKTKADKMCEDLFASGQYSRGGQ